METIYRNTANEDLIVFATKENAHASSIYDVAWELKHFLCNDKDYVEDGDCLLENKDEIIELCDKLLCCTTKCKWLLLYFKN